MQKYNQIIGHSLAKDFSVLGIPIMKYNTLDLFFDQQVRDYAENLNCTLFNLVELSQKILGLYNIYVKVYMYNVYIYICISKIFRKKISSQHLCLYIYIYNVFVYGYLYCYFGVVLTSHPGT